MLGKVKTIVEFAPRKRCITIEVEGKKCKTFVVESNHNSKQWKDVRVGDSLAGLDWFNEEERIIDADSRISLLKEVNHA